jgi:DNA modification methylase
MAELAGGMMDAVVTDPPYGITDCDWDVKLPPARYMNELFRISKINAAICVFGQQPFFTEVICSARRMFRYEIVWRKTTPTGFLNARRMPMRVHENIAVFYRKLPTYNPQRRSGRPYTRTRVNRSVLYKNKSESTTVNTGGRYPVDVLDVPTVGGFSPEKVGHPTQKPLELIEWLIKTYTNKGDLVFDPFMGSGTTGVACRQLGRRFIGIEKDRGFYEMAKKRIESANPQS